MKKYLFLFTLVWCYFIFNNLYAKSIIQSYDYMLDISGSTRLGFTQNISENFNNQYSYFNVEILSKNNLSQNLSAIFFVDYEYDSVNDLYNNELGSAYLGFNHNIYGKLFYGNTSSVYYNGFVGGWLDNGLSGGNEVMLNNENEKLLGTKNPNNTLYYSNKIDNLRFSIQLSGSYHNSTYDLQRNNGLGGNIIYAIGPLYFGASYLQANLTNNIVQNTYNFQLISYGLMLNIAGIYSALAFINEHNRDFIGEEALGLTYLLKYDYNNDSLGFIPQIIYGYKKYNNSNLISDNYLYTSLSYYFSAKISTFIDAKIDFRTNNQLDNLKEQQDNKITIGLKYDYY